MRSVASLALILIAVWFAPARGLAQAPSRYAYIQVPQAEVRAGRSDLPNVYPTNYLRQGTPIEVVDEKEGWVGIKPPPGSRSWIDPSKVNLITQSATNYMVTGPAGTKSVPTMIGPYDQNQAPSVEGVSLTRGAQVVAFAGYPPVKFGDKPWLAIEPPEGEVRWVKREMVGGLPAAPSPPPTGTGALVSGNGTSQVYSPPIPNQANPYPPPVGFGSLPPATPPPAANPTQLVNPQDRWNQAGAAEKAGQYQEALRIYTDMTQDYATSAPDWARFASNRAQQLRNMNLVQAFPSNPVQGVPAGQQYPDSFYRMPCQPSPAYPYTPGAPLVPYNTAPVPYAPVQQPIQQAPPVVMVPANPATPAPGATGKTVGAGLPRGRGYLRKSGRFVDRRPLYMLETIEGRPIYYMMPIQGVSLEPYMNHLVDVSGGTFYNPENRAEIMYVQQISLAPQ